MSKTRLLSVVFVVAALSAPMGSALADGHEPKQDPREMIEDSMRSVMMALKLFMKSIPQYEAPVILENGDILIRRVHPEDQDGDRESGPDSDRI
ncbi:hypothetical protein V5T82_03920 [Magnetovibrio sp. PR-2]|uniref:hypothetical protein n=1 Tax=Magnetovibrio sp. PR-2 TaxID=3120356 RepID=UPI002FCE622F